VIPKHERALLDASVVINFPTDVVAAHADRAAVSTITLAELSYGLCTDDPLINVAREQRYNWIVSTFNPIPFNTFAARIYGALCANVRATGRNPRPRRFDLLIAAVAVALGIPLITCNEADFVGIRDQLELIAVP
jgi:predicted nucleic acid-binding protein